LPYFDTSPIVVTKLADKVVAEKVVAEVDERVEVPVTESPAFKVANPPLVSVQ